MWAKDLERSVAPQVWATNALPYLIVVGTACFVAMNAYMVTKAHKEYDAMFMVAVYVGTTVLFGTVSSVIVLDEMNGLAVYLHLFCSARTLNTVHCKGC